MELDEKRVWLFGVIIACPLNEALKDCPFTTIRQKPVASQYKFVKELSDKEVDELIFHHKNCLFERELGRLKTGEESDKT